MSDIESPYSEFEAMSRRKKHGLKKRADTQRDHAAIFNSDLNLARENLAQESTYLSKKGDEKWESLNTGTSANGS